MSAQAGEVEGLRGAVAELRGQTERWGPELVEAKAAALQAAADGNASAAAELAALQEVVAGLAEGLGETAADQAAEAKRQAVAGAAGLVGLMAEVERLAEVVADQPVRTHPTIPCMCQVLPGATVAYSKRAAPEGPGGRGGGGPCRGA